jgi:hypothetical protein
MRFVRARKIDLIKSGYLNFYQQTSLRINYGYILLFITAKNSFKIQVLIFSNE